MKNLFIVISGAIGIGKSTFLSNLSEKLSEKYQVGGFITLGQETKRFVDLKTKEISLFREEEDKKGIRIGKYFIANRALNFVSKTLDDVSNLDIIFVDEIGKLESKKEGLFDTISKMFSVIIKEKIVILGVRQEIVNQLTDLFSIYPEKVWILSEQPSEILLDEVFDFIIESLK